MMAFIIRRLLVTIPILLGVSIVVFFLAQVVPGDPASAMLGPEASEQDVAALREALGLNEPLFVQYWLWLSRAIRLDFGTSVEYGIPVIDLLSAAFVNTAILTVAAGLLASSVGIVTGVLSATRAGSTTDRVTMLGVLFVNSLPPFWLGLMLVLIFSLGLGWFPTGGMSSLRGGDGPFSLLVHLVLPAITLATFSVALITRTTRASLLDVIGMDYVRTARSKGLSERSVMYGHALRNAMLPVVTVLGLTIGHMLGGAVLTETVFSWPGVGLAIYNAIGSRDLPVIQAGILLGAVVFVLINLVVDLLYGSLDPRIKVS